MPKFLIKFLSISLSEHLSVGLSICLSVCWSVHRPKLWIKTCFLTPFVASHIHRSQRTKYFNITTHLWMFEFIGFLNDGIFTKELWHSLMMLKYLILWLLCEIDSISYFTTVHTVTIKEKTRSFLIDQFYIDRMQNVFICITNKQPRRTHYLAIQNHEYDRARIWSFWPDTNFVWIEKAKSGVVGYFLTNHFPFLFLVLTQ